MPKRKHNFSKKDAYENMREKLVVADLVKTVKVCLRLVESGKWKKVVGYVVGKKLPTSLARLIAARNVPSSVVMRCEYV